MFVRRMAAFTQDGLGGNPAGIVLAAELPSPAEMQRIAAEVGYSETVFSAFDSQVWQTRYYSPESEVPFCGHATIALGAVLAHEIGDGTYPLSLAQGAIAVEASKVGSEYYSKLKSLPTRNSDVSDTVITEALALFSYTRSDVDSQLPIRRIHAGADHLHIPLRTRENLSAMNYDLAEGRAFMREHGFVTIALTWRETDQVFHTRNAFASGGVLEDPATGAAAAALAGFLRDEQITAVDTLEISQGVDMGSPSRIKVSFNKVIGAPVFVSGASTQIN